MLSTRADSILIRKKSCTVWDRSTARREEYKDQKEKAKKDLDVKNVLEEQMQSAQDELVMLNEQNINLGQMLATATERCTQQKQQ